jgi:NADH dehydrogenase
VQYLFNNAYYEVTLVDKNNYNYFIPLLYQVATSFLEPAAISYPFRKLFRKKNITYHMAEVLRVDPEARKLYLSSGEIQYDYLVFAAGAKTNFYGIESIRENALSLKGIDDALRMRNALLKTLEQATIMTDRAERKKAMNIVVAGAGPTGVELAGMLAEMKKYILVKDYPELKGVKGTIYIVDSGPFLLSTMSPETHSGTFEVLAGLGVEIKLNSRITGYTDGVVTLMNGDSIEAGTLIWAAGITANIFAGLPAASMGINGRMLTDEFNKVKGLDNIWAIGDISIQYTDPRYPNGHPQLAQVAIQHGRTLAKNFLALAANNSLTTFRYFDKGEMAIVGRHNAVVDLFKHKVHIKGFLALFIWLFIHVISLVNYYNKLLTLYNWVIAYLTRDQALRMIFRPDKKT